MGKTARVISVVMLTVQVTIGSQDLKANHSIEQIVEVVSEYEKYAK